MGPDAARPWTSAAMVSATARQSTVVKAVPAAPPASERHGLDSTDAARGR